MTRWKIFFCVSRRPICLKVFKYCPGNGTYFRYIIRRIFGEKCNEVQRGK